MTNDAMMWGKEENKGRMKHVWKMIIQKSLVGNSLSWEWVNHAAVNIIYFIFPIWGGKNKLYILIL